MRGLCISFTSSYFLVFFMGGKNFRTGGRVTNLGRYFCWWGQYTITWQVLLPLTLSHSHHLSSLQHSVLQYSFCSDKVFSSFSFTHFESGLCQQPFEFLFQSFLNLYNIGCCLKIIGKSIKPTLACKFHFIFYFYLLNPCSFYFSKCVIG